jgi:hypothetical protein
MSMSLSETAGDTPTEALVLPADGGAVVVEGQADFKVGTVDWIEYDNAFLLAAGD